ncbi:maleylpyruvate isomerase family mycothiol-dependent enzyme [Streptomyces sp. NPDC093225]|uniref:maleylpyruvate isomerase family mycothiol-dependent enzyme n=1 Tax=Streptomyces sp. NPDC093225 TaxID=3366034 RepID=UPI0037F66288
METMDYLKTLDEQGRSLADTAERAGLDAPVPTCPGWRVTDLLRHTGAVHRWAARVVGEPLREGVPLGAGPELVGAELLAWFREGHAALVETLEAAPADLECFTFLPGVTSPRTFWARRQAHETTVHRVDAESALGGGFSAVAPEFAEDGVDELLRGFLLRPRTTVRTDRDAERVMRVRATDTGAVWTARVSREPLVVVRTDEGPADCEVSAPAQWLYEALWNRRPLAGPAVSGDLELARLWSEQARI